MRNLMTLLGLLLVFFGCDAQNKSVKIGGESGGPTSFILLNGEEVGVLDRDASEWEAELSDMEYYVLRRKGTERAFTGDLLDNKKKGVYTCAGCSLPLFSSTTKFKSGTGWPSFYDKYKSDYVAEEVDTTYGMRRVEVLCARCGGHLGHVFDDGPAPTGLRYCINAVSLDFEEVDPKKTP